MIAKILANELKRQIAYIHSLNLGLPGDEEYLAKLTLIEEAKKGVKKYG